MESGTFSKQIAGIHRAEKGGDPSTATYAVVNDQREVVKQGLVTHWALSAYAAEAWAIISTCITASTRLEIFSDCETAVHHANIVFAGGTIPPTWACQEWWLRLAQIVSLRSGDRALASHQSRAACKNRHQSIQEPANQMPTRTAIFFWQ